MQVQIGPAAGDIGYFEPEQVGVEGRGNEEVGGAATAAPINAVTGHGGVHSHGSHHGAHLLPEGGGLDLRDQADDGVGLGFQGAGDGGLCGNLSDGQSRSPCRGIDNKLAVRHLENGLAGIAWRARHRGGDGAAGPGEHQPVGAVFGQGVAGYLREALGVGGGLHDAVGRGGLRTQDGLPVE